MLLDLNSHLKTCLIYLNSDVFKLENSDASKCPKMKFIRISNLDIQNLHAYSFISKSKCHTRGGEGHLGNSAVVKL